MEVAAVFGRLYREGRIRESVWQGLLDQLMADIASGRYNVVRTLVEDFFDAASLTRNYPLKAGDAIQLAVALRLRRLMLPYNHPLIFVTSDRTLRTAAEAEGFTTIWSKAFRCYAAPAAISARTIAFASRSRAISPRTLSTSS